MHGQVLELSNKADKLVDFAWEPRGTRFAMLHGDGPRPSFSLYAMKDSKTTTKGVQLVGTQTGKQANQICWSPQVWHLAHLFNEAETMIALTISQGLL